MSGNGLPDGGDRLLAKQIMGLDSDKLVKMVYCKWALIWFIVAAITHVPWVLQSDQ